MYVLYLVWYEPDFTDLPPSRPLIYNPSKGLFNTIIVQMCLNQPCQAATHPTCPFQRVPSGQFWDSCLTILPIIILLFITLFKLLKSTIS